MSEMFQCVLIYDKTYSISRHAIGVDAFHTESYCTNGAINTFIFYFNIVSINISYSVYSNLS